MSPPNKPASKATPVGVAARVVRYKFRDGTTEVVPLADVQAQLNRQIEQMIASDDVELHLAGLQARKRQELIAQGMAEAQASQQERLALSEQLAEAKRREIAREQELTDLAQETKQRLAEWNKQRALLPERDVLAAEIEEARARLGLSTVKAKDKIAGKYGVTRRALNKRLQGTPGRRS